MIPYTNLKYYVMVFLIGLILGGTLMYFVKKEETKKEEKVVLKKGESKISVTKGKEQVKEKWTKEKTKVAVLNNPVHALKTDESKYTMMLKDSSYTGTIDIVTNPRTDSIHVFTNIRVRELERLRVDTVLISRVDTLERVRVELKPNAPAFIKGFAAGVIVTALTVLAIVL